MRTLARKLTMELIGIVGIVGMLLGAVAGRLDAQPFTSGSDGRDGALEVTADTMLPLPPDGIFRFTTVNVANGATLQFQPNALNTPVHVLATGAVTIAGTINVGATNANGLLGGLPGPGGFRGGSARADGSVGSGDGPGGGTLGCRAGGYPDCGEDAVVGAGAYGSRNGRPKSGAVYGNSLILPLIGGSGGGAYSFRGGLVGGGGGGGGLTLASDSRIEVTGRIAAAGSAGSPGDGFIPSGGSGGGIRLVAPVVAGNGTIDVNGGNAGGGDGRIRIDSTDLRNLALNLTPGAASSIGSLMLVFLAPNPRLDLVAVAGQTIAEGMAPPVQIVLPVGSPTQQSATVRAHGFTGTVPIRIVLVPEIGDRTTTDAEIDMGAGGTVTVPLTFSPNIPTVVRAFSR